MFRTTHIRTKLAVALAVPLAALVAVAGFEVVTAVRDVDVTQSQIALATSSIGPGSLVGSLQDERNRAAIDLIGLGEAAGLPVADNAEARGLVDEAVPVLQAELARRGDEVTAAFAPAWEALAGLEALRADIDAYTGPMDLTNDQFANDVFTRYTDIIETFFDATSTVALAVDDADLRNGVEIVDAASRQSEMRARLVRSIVLATVTGTAAYPPVGQEVAALDDRSRGFDEDVRANATGPYAGIADATFTEPGVQSFNRQVEAFLAGQPVSIGDLLGAVKSEPGIGYLGLRSRASDALRAEAHRIESNALDRQRLFGGIAIGALLLALVVTWIASRSITRPLASLRAQADEMAGTRLPAVVRRILDTPPGEDVVIPQVEPIRVKSRDEVAQVAAALSAVQSSAVDLAVEQTVLRRNISDSYINLGRRNQNLLSRQLDFITDLERNESDPDTLEGLFRLDHLATRMRRNAESLLVLSGVEPPRQWSAPVKVSDVVRAALGEVEDYQRVVVRHLEPASVTGAVAADIAHVLAELIENGLSFSPPEHSVEVKGRLTTSGYTLAIADNGFGMSSEELERANRRLAGRESFTVAPSRYLGHYVAGHLASRLGVVVELQDSPAGGVTARVDIPMGLLANEETDPRLVRLQASAPSTAPAPAPAAGQPASARPAAEPAAPSGPEAPAPAPSLTASGLPRRGDRPAAPSIDLDAPAPMPPGSASPAAPPADAPPVPVAETPAVEAPAPAPVAESPVAPPPPVTEVPAPVAEVRAPVAPAAPAPAAHLAGHRDSRPTAPSPMTEVPVPPAPTTPDGGAPDRAPAQRSDALPARGFGGLAVTRPIGGSMYTVAAQNARQGAAPDTDADDDTVTRTGLTRRVPGAQRPDATFGAARSYVPDSAPTASREPVRSSPEDVYSFLSSFQSGVAKGRVDAQTDTDADTDDDAEPMEGGR